jgi:hypothetical protein
MGLRTESLACHSPASGDESDKARFVDLVEGNNTERAIKLAFGNRDEISERLQDERRPRQYEAIYSHQT